VHFLARGGVPRLRRQAVLKSFGLEARPRSASHVEDVALHRRGVAIDGSPHRYLCVRYWKPQSSRGYGAFFVTGDRVLIRYSGSYIETGPLEALTRSLGNFGEALNESPS
jgi:hypothetical protein